MVPAGNGPNRGPVPPQQLQHGVQDQYTNPPQMHLAFPDNQGYFLAHTNLPPAVYPPPLANPSQPLMYPSQPPSFPYFPPNQEQLLNQRQPTKAPASQQPSTSYTSRSTTASEDEGDDTRMEQEIQWQTVKVTKRKTHRLTTDPSSQAIPLANKIPRTNGPSKCSYKQRHRGYNSETSSYIHLRCHQSPRNEEEDQ